MKNELNLCVFKNKYYRPMEEEGYDHKEEKYFDLMEKVGTKGCYQWIVYGFSMLTFLYNALATNNLPMLFYSAQFDCSNQNLTQSECQKYVCDHLSVQQRNSFPVNIEMQSLATQFGPYHCEQNIILSLYRACMGFGQFIGMFVAVMISDNISRRKAFLFCLLCSNIGMLVIFLARSMEMAVVGIFIVGLSNAPNLRICQAIITEITENERKQKYLSSQLGAYSLGGIIIGTIYSWIGHWRYSILYCGLLPGLLIMIGFYLMVEDTPKFLLREPASEALRALNRIGKINTGEQKIIKSEQILERIQKQKQIKGIKSVTSPIDLLRYKSLRSTSILCIIIFMFCDLLFYFHSTVTEQVGVNPQFNSLMIGLGQLSAIPWAVLLIPKFERKKIFWTTFSIGIILSLTTSSINTPSECDYCQQGIIQMALIALTRLFIISFWCCLYNYFTEFFPVSILSIGMGIPTAFGGLGMSICQIVFLSASEKNINVFIIAACIMVIVIFLVCGLPETYYMEKRDQIDEVKQIYQQNHHENKKIQ